MSWRRIARKDFRDARRSRVLWGVSSAAIAVVLLVVLAFGPNGAGDDLADTVAVYAAFGGQLIAPLIGLLVAYRSIVDERESGSLFVLYGLPHTRRDVVLGTAAGRAGVAALTILIAFAVGGITIGLLFGTLPIAQFVGLTALALLVGIAFVTIAVGISAVVRTRGRALAAAVGTYLLCLLFWHPLVAVAYRLGTGSQPAYDAPGWYFLLLRLNPLEAYRAGATGVLDGSAVAPLFGWFHVVEDIPDDATPHVVATRITEIPPYLEWWTVVPIIGLWIALPLAVGIRRFVRADLI